MVSDEELLQRYPAISDLARLAKRRMPHFAWEFLDSGTGEDVSKARNRSRFDAVTLTPRFMQGEFAPELSTELFGSEYSAPFGIAPVGMNSLAWPGTDRILARTAARHRIPYSMSTAANETIENLGKLADGMGWFQLYPPRNPNMRVDLLARAREAGFTTLLVTVDVPVISRRERQMRAGVGGGFRLSPSMVWQCMTRPQWSMATVSEGKPRLPSLERYSPTDDLQTFLAFVGEELNGTFDWSYVDSIRNEWDGPMVLKGIMSAADAQEAVRRGVDGIMVSNHGGRQLDGAPASIEVLPEIAGAVGGQARIILDSGVRGGMDIARSLALGADFVMLGRAFMFGAAALGERGGEHTARLLRTDLSNVMSNLGCRDVASLRDRVASAG
ncbi:MAG: alpha-hydroxy acid oxidase [Pseudomonadota bacterium]